MNILLVINEQKDPGYVLANQVSELIGTRANLFIDGKHRSASVKNAKKISENEYAGMDVIWFWAEMERFCPLLRKRQI